MLRMSTSLLAYLWTVQLCVAFTALFYYEQESDGSIDEEAEEDRCDPE